MNHTEVPEEPPFLIEAVVWDRPDAVRRWVRFFRTFKKRFGVGVSEMELDCYLATVKAREGDLMSAIELFQKHETNSVGRAYYFSRLSGIYEAAEDFQRMIEYRRKAVEESQGGQNERIDYALALLQRLRDPEAAERVLDGIEEENLIDLGQAWFCFCRGLIALEKGDDVLAEEKLRVALEKEAPYRGNPMIDAGILEMKAFLSISLARQGRLDEARRLFAEAALLLRARREHDLLERCASALGV